MAAASAAKSESACPASGRGEPAERPRWRWLEVLAICVLFALYAGQAPPAVNEAHYWTKARHAWDPTWCDRDLFLASSDAHFVFTRLFGWLAAVCPLPLAVWIARTMAWFALAVGWQRLSFAVVARPGLSILTAMLWLAIVDWGTMAGEWVVGGVEAKCFAYAAVCLGLADVQRQRWNRGLVWFGVATAMHVLVGGWALVAAGAAWLACGVYRPPLRSLALGLVAAVLCALPGLVPALALTRGVDREVVAESAWIYVYGRLSHHLVFHRLELTHIVRHVAWVGVWIAVGMATPCRLSRSHLDQRPLRGFVGGAICLSICGALIDQLLLGRWELSASLLRYYWFRTSDAWLPAGAALAIIAAAVRWRDLHPRLARTMLGAATLFASVNLYLGAEEHGVLAPSGIDPQWQTLQRLEMLRGDQLPGLRGEWESICGWIRTHTPSDSLWITPRNQQTFKWFAERAEVVNVKDIPQDAASVVAWQWRREAVFPPETSFAGLSGLGETRLVELAQTYGADYILVDEWQGRRVLKLPVVYPPADQPTWFRIYAIPSAGQNTP
ncbi:MAG: DUF6798 domain-containing protein [Pirellulales bacterium]